MTFKERRLNCTRCNPDEKIEGFTKKLLWDADPRGSCDNCGTALVDVEGIRYGAAPGVIGDECDVLVRHGLCNEDGSARRYTSKSEMKREAWKRGLQSHVEHKPLPGSDKSPHTTRWV